MIIKNKIIYDLDKIKGDYKNKLLLFFKNNKKSHCSVNSTIIKDLKTLKILSDNFFTESKDYKNYFYKTVHINKININNIYIKDNKLIGDLTILPINYTNTSHINLIKENYKFLFKPAFYTTYNIKTNKFEVYGFEKFNVYLTPTYIYRKYTLDKVFKKIIK